MGRLLSLMGIFYLIQAFGSNPGLASLPLALYLKETIGLSAAELGKFSAIAFIPWMIKPLWGIISDSFTLFGYQIKSYLLICYTLALLIFLGLSQLRSYTTFSLLFGAVLVSACIAFSDVLADKLMVMEGKARSKTAILQAAQWTALGFGGAIMYYFSGWLAKNATLSSVFLLSAIVPLVGLAATLLLLRENKVELDKVSSEKSIQVLFSVAKSRNFLAIICFIIFMGFSPVPPLLFYERDVLKFTEEFLGILGAVKFLGIGLGALFFGIFARNVSRRLLLNQIIGLSVISTHCLVFMYDRNSAIVVLFLNSFTSMIAVLGVLEISARACPKGVEGTTYALLVSISNFAFAVGAILGGWLYDRGIAFSILVIVSAMFTSLCWFLIPIFKLEKG
ncbi:MFS transporter [Argonema antarcticum]|uniref:MFS transporter n=1 Tax=Argonema antarcticum TaxID=2942763 RepID=UPI00201184E9|nr:MFS transporter [Argonema antarcticum]MCL1471050.1 MFS transporter [Argonema antarcticum A004/B2]